MAELTRKQMAQLVIKLRLASHQQVQDCLEQMTDSGLDPEPFLAELSRQGMLTYLQVDKLLKGDMHGYYMGTHRLLYKIHSGSFGRVYRAEDPDSKRVYAVKVLRQRWTDKPEVIQMFEREGRLGMSLRHPNIVEVLSVGKDQHTGQYYIVMEFVEGANLRDLLQIRKKFDTIETLKLLDDVASALTYAYARGITHRDMKPTNVLISSQGMAKVTDYGLAQISSRFVTDDDKTSQQRTVDYAGLEKAMDAPYGDVRSDVFFSGCVAYEMLTGKGPLALSKNKHARMARDRFMNMKKLTMDQIDGPGADTVHRLVTTMMALDPEQRYQTPAQLLDAVKQARAEVTGGTIGTHTNAITIFIAEPDEKLQDIMREKIKKLGYRVLISGDPARAFDRFQQSPFNVLLVDLGTVGEEGLVALHKVLRKVRSVNHECHAIAIFSEEQDELEGQIEFDIRERTTVMRRPVKMNELITKLREIAPPDSSAAA